MKRIWLVLAVLALVWPTIALAEPKTGLGLYVGYAQDSGSQKDKATSASTSYDSSGPAIGVDFQFKLGSSVSLGVFAEATAGDESVSCSQCTGSNRVNRTALGLEFRYWIDAIFLGLRGESAASTFMGTSSSGSTTSDFAGSGFGLAAGWEGAGGLFVKFAYDNTIQNYSKSGVKIDDTVDSLRLFLGYRF